MSRSEPCELSIGGQQSGVCESRHEALAARLDHLFRKSDGCVAASELKAALYWLRADAMTTGCGDESV